MKDEAHLKLETRRKIFLLIKKSPGVHKREISRKLNIPLTTVRYHLQYLVKRNLIKETQDTRYHRYYAVGIISTKDKEIISALQQPIQRKIIVFLLLQPHAIHKDICNHLTLPPSTISFHLTKLLKRNIVQRTQEGRETHLSVNEPEYIADLLITYQKGFLDAAVDRFVSTWEHSRPGKIRKKDH